MQRVVPARARSPRSRAVRGFSMIELLVAVLVMGVGVLGVAGLQMVSLQNSRASLQRTEAIQLAYDMMDRVRANPEADYALALGGPLPVPPAGNCRGATRCTANQMANLDRAVWKCSLGGFRQDAVCAGLGDLVPRNADGTIQAGLPDGDGTVVRGANELVTVTVQWTDFDGETRTVRVSSQGLGEI